MAHGAAGVVAFLGLLCRSGLSKEVTAETALGAIRWILSQPRSAHGGPQFARRADHGAVGFRGWCWGDTGIASGVLFAARSFGQREWEQAAIDIAAVAASERRVPVNDAALCHGASGQAHMFNRLYQTTGDDRFLEATRHWIDRSLGFFEAGGVSGLRSRMTTPDSDEGGWMVDYSLMNGLAGVGLALLATVDPRPPGWDQLMMLSSS